MHLPQHAHVSGGGATITQNQCRECDHLCPAGKKMHTGLRFSSTDCDVTLQDSCHELSLTEIRCVFWFHSRFIKIWRVERLRVAGCVCVERVAVVESVRLPRSLVLGKVPASGELGLQSLWGDVNKENDDAPRQKDRDFLHTAVHGSGREMETWILEARAQKRNDSPQLSGVNHWRCWGLISWQRESVESCCHIHLTELQEERGQEKKKMCWFARESKKTTRCETF